MNNLEDTLAAIDGITSVDDTDELRKLEANLDELFQSTLSESSIETLFHLFERFPNDDAYGIFWTILHHMERQPDYKPYLRASVLRVPMEFNLMMVNRLLNSDLSDAERQEWLALLGEVQHTSRYSQTARDQAQDYLEYYVERFQEK